MTPSGHILRTRTNRDEISFETIPVIHHGEPAEDEALRHKSSNRNNVNTNGSDPVSEEYARWGFQKKVDFSGVTRTPIDFSETQDLTGISRNLRDKLHDLYVRRVLTNENEDSLVPYDFMQTDGGPRVSVAPTSSDLYGIRATTSRGLKRTLSCNALKDKILKANQSRSSANMLKLPKDMQGRWSSERYKSAQLKLIEIMHERRAVPGRPILRPALREEARKHIGDTGLLDHLLKHMTDTVVSTGERFRRRHNAEGAMEYWLEDASLMEIRKAAGIEDPSWLPPQGWKPGDKFPGVIWGCNRSMSSSEAAEMSQLKAIVERLKREMTFLCAKLKGLKQAGGLQVLDTKEIDGMKQNEDFQEVLDEKLNKKIETIRKEMQDFKKDMISLQKQHDREAKTKITSERFQMIEHDVLQITKEQREEKSAGSSSLEKQLADVRQEVHSMQLDVQSILKFLGFSQYISTSPINFPQDEGVPSLLSGCKADLSTTPTPVSWSRGILEAQLEPFVWEYTSVSSATSSSTDAAAPITKDIDPVKEHSASYVKLGGSSVVKGYSRPGEDASSVWPNVSSKSSTRSTPINATQWNDYINHSQREQPGSASTTNSPEGSPVHLNLSGAVRTYAKDCPVAAAMAGMFGCLAHVNQYSIRGENLEQFMRTARQQPQPRFSTFDNVMSNRIPTPSAVTRSEEVPNDSKLISSRFERALATGQSDFLAPSAVAPSACEQLDSPLSLSLSLTLGSQVSSDVHVGADSTCKHN